MREVTLLWALRSACALACRYCYFGQVEEHRDAMPTQPGILSHLSRNDLRAEEAIAFARTLADSPVARVVIAGGEPLDWPHTPDLIEAIKAAGCQVVIATNGIPLNRPALLDRIIHLGVDGVSVSLDSADPEANDRYRPSRSARHGHDDVLRGIRALLAARAQGHYPRIGLYTVVTRQTVEQITVIAELAVSLGVDYYVPQPISLTPDHALDAELSPRPRDLPAIADQLAQLYHARYPLALPDPAYMRRFVSSITSRQPGRVADCFGGSRLFFIQPDGSLWDCPSALRIAATPPPQRRTILGADARALLADRPACTDCSHFSRDCVSMWPLTLDLPRILHQEDTIR
jgi:MoaA/NifB/PqqE/SkfB family radical SAM enzyme